jgi:hypothetical protein
MSKTNDSKRGELVRNTVVFQLKLMADGLRDLFLLPISLIAALIGLLRGGDEPEREFNQIIELGRESEQWINLFGNHSVDNTTHPVASMDSLFEKVEETLKQQYKTAGISERARNEIDHALQAVQDKTSEDRKIEKEPEA